VNLAMRARHTSRSLHCLPCMNRRIDLGGTFLLPSFLAGSVTMKPVASRRALQLKSELAMCRLVSTIEASAIADWWTDLSHSRRTA
jgi:hypothetical protein